MGPNHEAWKRWRDKDPERYYRVKRDAELKRNYGISLVEYEEMLAKQGGRCAVCGVKSDKTLHLDHNHKTGKVRGLLCHKCNSGLGSFNDDVELLIRAAEYLGINDG